jgi:hypothetical protein
MTDKPLPDEITRLLNGQNLDYRRSLAKLRKAAEDEVERLIAFLDKIAPDPDLEPYLSDTNGEGEQDIDTIEWDGDCDDEAGEPVEPSLSALENIDQSNWSQGNRRERELDEADHQ